MATKKKKSITKTAANALSNTGRAIAKNPRTSLYVGVGVVAILGVYFFYDSLKKATDGIGDDPNAGGGTIDLGNNPGSIPIGATITNAQAQTGAAELLSAVDSVGQLSTSEFDRVKNVLRGKNATDFAMLSKAFGTPSRSPLTGEESPWFLGEKLSLSQWLSIETKDWQKAQLRQMLPTVF